MEPPSTGAERELLTWSSASEYETGPSDPVDDFKNGARVVGNPGSAEEYFRRADLVRKEGDQKNLIDSSLIGKSEEWPPFLRGNTESSFNRDLGVSVLAFPLLKPAVSLKGREVRKVDTLAETHDSAARHSWCLPRGSGERRLSCLLSCSG